jgi:hypothetical protein
MKMHTDAQCKVKLKGIKMLSEQLMRRYKGADMDNYALSESITVMCDELLREFPDDEED